MALSLPVGWSPADFSSYVDPILADCARERIEWVYARTPQDLLINVTEWLATGATSSPLPTAWSMPEFTEWVTNLIAAADSAYNEDVLSKIPFYLRDFTLNYIAAGSPADQWAGAVISNGGTVSAARKAIIQSFIAAEMAAGTWALTDDYWCFWAENPQQALTSIKQKRLAVAVNAPVFLPNRHYEFDGVANYINTGFIPSTHAVALTGSEQRLAVYERTNVTVNATSIGAYTSGPNNFYLRARASGVICYASLNVTTAASFTLPSGDSRGWTAASRAGGGTTLRGFKNGVAMADATGFVLTSNTLQTHSLFIGGQNTNGALANPRAASVGFAVVGAPLSTQQEKDQFDNIQNWAIAAGAAVVGQDEVTLWANAVIANGGSISTTRRAQVTNLVAALKASNTWDLVDDLWLLVAENPPQALTSLKQRRLATAINAPVFTIDRGYAFNGTSNYIDTGFICATHAVAMTGTSMHIAVYERSNTAHGGIAAGGFNFSSQGLSIAPRLNTNLLQIVLNSQAVGPGGDVLSDSRGLSVGSRNGTLAADVLGYRNGVPVVPQTPGTLTNNLTTQKTLIGAQMNNVPVPISFRAATEGFVSVGAAIPAASQAAFYQAVQTFMSGVGAAIPPWSPLDLGASLLAWWDAERLDLITRDGNGRVSSWKDVVGGYNLTQPTPAAQPIYSATSFNGRPGIAPDGVDDYLELSTGLSWLPAGATPADDWYLVDQTSPAADGLLWALGSWGSNSNANSRTTFRQVVSGVNRATGNVTSGNINTLVDFSGRHIVRLAVSATGYIIEIDGQAMPEFAVVPATNAARIRMFANSNTTVASFGKAITSTRIITGALTTQQAYDLRTYLSSRIKPVDPDVAAWAAAVVVNGGTVSAERKAIVEAFIIAEKAAGTWALTDDYWVLWGENAAQALTSLKQRRLATAINAPVFTIDRGYAFDGTSNYINTGFIPSTHAVAMTGSEQRLAVYERANVSTNTTSIGTFSAGPGNLYIRARSSSTSIAALNTSTVASFSTTDSRGFTAFSRAGGGTTIRSFRNGVAMPDATGLTLTTNAQHTVSLVIGGQNSATVPTTFRATSIGFAVVGAPLSGTQEAAQYANVQTWAATIGAQV